MTDTGSVNILQNQLLFKHHSEVHAMFVQIVMVYGPYMMETMGYRSHYNILSQDNLDIVPT